MTSTASPTTGGYEWELNGTLLRVRTPDGRSFVPRARDIFSCVFRGLTPTDVEGWPAKESPGIPDLSFSRFPLEPKIVLEAIAPEGVPTVRLTTKVAVAGVEPIEIDPRGPDHVVLGGVWYPLVGGGLEYITQILSSAQIKAVGSITIRQYLDLRRAAGDEIQDLVPEQIGQIGALSASLRGRELVTGELYPYQQHGLAWLCRLADEQMGCILADEMGLGKTLQIIALLAREKALDRSPALIVCPATLVENWRRELARFAPNLHAIVHQGALRTGFPKDLFAHDVTITSYNTFVSDYPLFAMLRWNIHVVDEAQSIKNPDSKRSRVTKQLRARVRIAVTGTPVENRLQDLWSLADFIAPGFLGDRVDFERDYANDAANARRLSGAIRPLLLRRTVAEVAGDLPAKIMIPVAIPLSPTAAQEYESIRESALNDYPDGGSLAALTRLRMFCAHPLVISDALVGDPAGDSTKYLRLTEILEEIFSRGLKVLVFAAFSRIIDVLHYDLQIRFGVPSWAVDGRTPVEARHGIIDAFSGVAGAAVLILNPRAAGTGLNITAASHVVHYTPEWNPAVEDQATARAYRRGQTRPVTVHRLYHSDTVEEVMIQRLEGKRELANYAVPGRGDDDAADVLRALVLSPIFPHS